MFGRGSLGRRLGGVRRGYGGCLRGDIRLPHPTWPASRGFPRETHLTQHRDLLVKVYTKHTYSENRSTIICLQTT